MSSDLNSDSNSQAAYETEDAALDPLSTAGQPQFQAAEILDRVADAFLILDRHWRIIYANREACRINQKPLAEFIGKIQWEEWPAAVGTELERQLRRAMDERVEVHFEHRYVSEPYDVWLENDAYPTEDGLSIFYRDITARKRSEEALRRSQEDLQMAVDAAEIGIFYCEYPLDKIIWNDTCKTHFFLPPDADVDITLFYSLLHPDDREPTRQAIERALEDHVGYDVEYRTLGPQGQTRWINAVGRFYYAPDGTPTRFDGITLDISARKSAAEALRVSESARHAFEEQLQDAQARLETALAAGGIATWTWDVTSNRVVADTNLAQLFSVSPEDADGGRIETYLQAIFPDDRPRVEATIGEALTHRGDYEAEYRVVLPDGSHRWLATRGRVERDESGRAVSLPGVVLDITEQAERRRRERFLADLAERARGLTAPDDVIADAVNSVGRFLNVSRCLFVDIDLEADVCTGHRDYRANDAVPSMAGVFPLSAFGEAVVAAYASGRTVIVDDVQADPDQVPEWSVATYDTVGIRAHASVPVMYSNRLVACMGIHSDLPRHWKPEEVELLQTVVERTWLTVEVIRQQRALVREAEERREAHERTAHVLESITDAFFTLDAEWRFTYLNDKAQELLMRSRTDLLGKNVWEEFPAAVGADFYRQYQRAVSEQATVTFEDYYPPPLDTWFEVRAYPSPDGLSVYFHNINERRSLEQEREQLLLEAQARSEREALLNRVGQAVRGSLDPEKIQKAAVDLLGEALGADRCYFALYDLGGGTVTVAHDWHRSDLLSIRAVYPFANTAEMFRELYQGSNTSVIRDAHTAALSDQTKANMESLRLRARVSVALVDGDGLMATLTVSMTDAPRQWSDDEISLVEAVATQLRTAVEMARITQREHTIATQLQEALQPDLPGTVPGLALARYYRPALAEAGVGGDFYDVFAIEKGCTALVVGDLSGKGLAAAAQVSTVRNMLRAFLYSRPTVSEAVTELNRVLAENSLLTGFTTLFVGAYDSATGLLNYVNCGQEPALVRRSDTGAVDQLISTGPILGAIEGVRYTEATATLKPGDAVAVFTDGLTEVGASRKKMLGVEGVAALMAAQTLEDAPHSAAQMAEALSQQLIAGVDAFAQSGARDDMCLLVGVVDGR